MCRGSCLQAVKAQELFTAIFSFSVVQHRGAVRRCHFILRSELEESTAKGLRARVLQGALVPVGDTAGAQAPPLSTSLTHTVEKTYPQEWVCFPINRSALERP